MANTIRKRGFRPIRHIDGSAYNDASMQFLCTESTATFIGDVVNFSGTSGSAGTIVSGIDCEGMKIVQHSTNTSTGTNIAGIVTGFVPVDTLPGNFRASAAVQIVLVCTDPTVVYEVQEDGDTTPLTSSMMGNNIDLVSGAGSTVTGASAYAIDSTATATASTHPFKLLGLVKRPDNAFNTGGSLVDMAKFEVLLNVSDYTSNASGT
jgi:hypothetical protein